LGRLAAVDWNHDTLVHSFLLLLLSSVSQGTCTLLDMHQLFVVKLLCCR
jgi:hypothetical protein